MEIDSFNDNSKKPYWFIVLFFGFIIYSPIYKSGDLRYFLPEFMLYFIVMPYVLLKNMFNIYLSPITKLLIKYVVSYVLVIGLVMILKGSYLIGHIYQFRLILMVFVWAVFLDNYFYNRDIIQTKNSFKWMIKICLMAPIVAVITYLNSGFRDFIYGIYSPVIAKYRSTGVVDAGFREPGIFKDYYTATVFYFIMIFALFLQHYKYKHDKFNLKEIIFIIVALATTLITGRTGFYVSLVFLMVMNIRYFKKIKISISVIFILPLLIYGFVEFISRLSIKNLQWAFEIFKNDGEVKSNKILSNTIEAAWEYFNINSEALFIPLHVDNFGLQYKFYSDSFYIQELIRHGIWGVSIYLIFVITLLIYFIKQKNLFGVILIAFLSFLNIKGGNVFFMERYAILLWTVIYFLDKRRFLYD